jgi:hypothetical protein
LVGGFIKVSLSYINFAQTNSQNGFGFGVKLLGWSLEQLGYRLVKLVLLLLLWFIFFLAWQPI